ncbi:reticulocyte-binding protein 2 homolog a-like [Polistes fuscatus]|uniref:reticulocyte-binding protein 2 homolog a-like n=1 Tax=Polistes fuscatus TaxID=30207 RepID=UPI001CA93BC4|nr:reticulocyte-binding protein 2 homolog a-like [Polistes fuscatus]
MTDDNVNFSFNWKDKNNCIRMYNKNHDKVYNNATTLNLKYSSDFSQSDPTENPSIVDLGGQFHEKLKSSSSGSEFRFINPAIYVESLNTEDNEKETTTNIRIGINHTNNNTKILNNGDANDCRFVEFDSGDGIKKTTDMLSDLSLKKAIVSSRGDLATDDISSPETYRCYFSTSSTASSVGACSARHSESIVNVKPVSHRVQRRCKIVNDEIIKRDQRRPFSSNGMVVGKEVDQPEAQVQRYILNGHRVVHISTTSISSSNISQMDDEPLMARKSAHEEWLRKKQIYLQRKKEKEDMMKTKEREEEERLEREREEKERRERENFVKWTERKKKEEADKKAALENEMKMEKQLKELEEKTVIAKALCLRQWARKKEEEQKAQEKALQLKEQQEEEERKRRQEESVKAYEEWREKSRNRPKPATQGLFPHQAAKPGFINPTPWQKLIEDDSNDDQEDSKKTKIKRRQNKRKNK